jgi:pseudaminic acid biosynthesis-associated methylase
MLRDTEQFWKGPFGDSYTARCAGENLIEANEVFFDHALRSTCYSDIESIIEFGANRGLNILALQRALDDAKFSAVEINEEALGWLRKIEGIDVLSASIVDFAEAPKQYDLSLAKGILIHIHPEDLKKAYSALYTSTRRYILIAEYYNPKPVEIEYRGHTGRLWKRDFAGEMMDLYPDLKLVDYGFVWRRDPVMPQDDLTWFLMERPSA